ncbi:Bud-site selection protein [Abortiporus biennis]|nr:Bud-site selection protein [Abortiporus biennis]
MPENDKKSLKRKRQQPSAEETRDSKLASKLHHGAKEVRKAAKKAKTFETQRLVKKLKGLRVKNPKGEDIADLETQLETLKKCDHEPLGNTALKTKIMKDYLLSKNEVIIEAITRELASNLVVAAPPGTSSAKVQARLLSSKALASEVVSIVDSLRQILQPQPKVEEARNDEDEEVGQEEGIHRPKKLKKSESVFDHTPSSDSDDDEDVGSSGKLSVLDEDDAEVDDGGWESGSIGGNDSEAEGDSDDENASDDSQGSDDDKDLARPLTSAKPTKSSKVAPKASGVESTFLPSLAVGFTRGDSDVSDFSDDEGGADVLFSSIWEKKYGRNANHVKNHKEEEVADNIKQAYGRGRPQGQNAKNSHDRSNPRSQAGRPGRGGPFPSTGANQQPIPEKPKKEDKPLHPSWEAKKKLKEKLNPVIVAPQGKKIVF